MHLARRATSPSQNRSILLANPGARLMGASSAWLQPEAGAGSFSIELVLGAP